MTMTRITRLLISALIAAVAVMGLCSTSAFARSHGVKTVQSQLVAKASSHREGVDGNNVVCGGVHTKAQLLKYAKGGADPCGHRDIGKIWAKLGITPAVAKKMHLGEVCGDEGLMSSGRQHSPQKAKDKLTIVNGGQFYARPLSVWGSSTCYKAWVGYTEDGKKVAVLIECGNGEGHLVNQAKPKKHHHHAKKPAHSHEPGCNSTNSGVVSGIGAVQGSCNHVTINCTGCTTTTTVTCPSAAAGGTATGGSTGGNATSSTSCPPEEAKVVKFTASVSVSVTVTVSVEVSCPTGSTTATARASATASASGSGSAESTVSQADADAKARAQAEANATASAHASAEANAEVSASAKCTPEEKEKGCECKPPPKPPVIVTVTKIDDVEVGEYLDNVCTTGEVPGSDTGTLTMAPEYGSFGPAGGTLTFTITGIEKKCGRYYAPHNEVPPGGEDELTVTLRDNVTGLSVTKTQRFRILPKAENPS